MHYVLRCPTLGQYRTTSRTSKHLALSDGDSTQKKHFWNKPHLAVAQVQRQIPMAVVCGVVL